MNNKTKYYDNYFYFPLLLCGAISLSYFIPAIIFLNQKYIIFSLMFVWGVGSVYKQIKKEKQDRITFIVVMIINFLLILSYEYYGSELIILTVLTSILWVGHIYLKFVNTHE